MSETLTYTDFEHSVWGSSTSLKYVIYNANERWLAINYRTSPNKWYVYNVSDSERGVFREGIERATSKGRYVNDWTLGRHSDRVVDVDPSRVVNVALVPESQRKSAVTVGTKWKAVFAVGDVELTLTETLPAEAEADAEATLRDKAAALVTKGEPRLRELTRTFE